VLTHDPLKREIQVQVFRPIAGDSCDGGISVLYNCLSWYKFVNTHLSHSRQLYNIHIMVSAVSNQILLWIYTHIIPQIGICFNCLFSILAAYLVHVCFYH